MGMCWVSWLILYFASFTIGGVSLCSWNQPDKSLPIFFGKDIVLAREGTRFSRVGRVCGFVRGKSWLLVRPPPGVVA